jgi:pyruvate kinase
MNKVKIIATIGPSSSTPKVLESLINSGLSLARLNFSHGTHKIHAQNYQNIKQIAKKLKKDVKIIQDLQGLKIRVKSLARPIRVRTGRLVTIGEDFLLDKDISPYVKIGDFIYIEDGLLEFQVKKISNTKIICKSINGGLVQSHKGINLPQAQIPNSSLTEKDLNDLNFGLKYKPDFVAISFIHNAQEVADLKKVLKTKYLNNLPIPKIIAKIEKPQAVLNIDSIIKEADLIMIARGDLGVELSDALVPVHQKNIILKCNKQKKPVIVATHMLDSMIQNPRPTRAEVNDVANAVLDGANFVMLSGETAIGKYPIKAVQKMEQIVKVMESLGFKN